MFYVLSKVLDVAVTPLAWCVLLVALGVLARGDVWQRRGLPLLGAVVLVVFSLEPVSNSLFRRLETPPLSSFRPGVTYDVAILLGGIGEDRVEGTWGERAFNDNNERLLETFDLLRAGRVKYAIVSGGAPSESRTKNLEAQVLADQLVAWGVDESRIIVEGRARNTHENAVFSAAIVRQRAFQSVLLVTSAFHMPRALGCFRAEGLAVDTLPVDFRSFSSQYPAELLPRAEYLAVSTAAIREEVGRFVYRLHGYAR